MSTYKVRLQHRQIFETTIEVEADTTVAAIDLARKVAKTERLDFQKVSETDPVMVSITEKT